MVTRTKNNDNEDSGSSEETAEVQQLSEFPTLRPIEELSPATRPDRPHIAHWRSVLRDLNAQGIGSAFDVKLEDVKPHIVALRYAAQKEGLGVLTRVIEHAEHATIEFWPGAKRVRKSSSDTPTDTQP